MRIRHIRNIIFLPVIFAVSMNSLTAQHISDIYEMNGSNILIHNSIQSEHGNESTLLFLESPSFNSDEFTDGPSPAGALLRSFVLPGWGHYYVNKDDWNRGKIHLLADITLIGSYLGLTINANRLENNLYTYARQHANTEIRDRGRDYLLSVAEFISIDAYNDYQERSRNWDRIYDVNTANSWHWDSDQHRLSFLKLDNRVQHNRQQLPAIASLMVVNRIISGISAYSRAARMRQDRASSFTITVPEGTGGHGFQANYRISF